MCGGAVLAGAAGLLLGGPPGALFGAAGGVLLGWAVSKDAVVQALLGAVKGVVFVFLIGPGADWLLSRQPVFERLELAFISGALLGTALGVKNAAKPKNRPVERDALDAHSQQAVQDSS